MRWGGARSADLSDIRRGVHSNHRCDANGHHRAKSTYGIFHLDMNARVLIDPAEAMAA
jgi:hypothetical protein